MENPPQPPVIIQLIHPYPPTVYLSIRKTNQHHLHVFKVHPLHQLFQVEHLVRPRQVHRHHQMAVEILV